MNPSQNLSLEDISKLGEKHYNENWKADLEANHLGEYAVIDVQEKKYVTDGDRLAAIEKAQAEFGQKLFYIIQIGGAQIGGINFKSHKYAWDFR